MTPSWTMGSGIFQLERARNPLRKYGFSFSCLGKLAPAGGLELDVWNNRLDTLLASEGLCHEVRSARVLVVGLTESGIVPSFLVHELLKNRGVATQWACSSRRAIGGFSFREAHSHAPRHLLRLPEQAPDELWMVEDELTTGQTAVGLALELCRVLGVRKVRIIAFLDIRSRGHRSQVDALFRPRGITVSIHAVFDRLLHNGRGAAPLAVLESPAEDANREEMCTRSNWMWPDCRPALGPLADAELPFEAPGRGTLLVVGEAIDLGLRLVRSSRGMSFQHVTLSPWKVGGEAIKDRVDVGGAHYVYNPHLLQKPVYVLHDPVDASVARGVQRGLGARGLEVRSWNPLGASGPVSQSGLPLGCISGLGDCMGAAEHATPDATTLGRLS